MQYIDLTHTFTDGMPVYPGDSPSELKQTTTLEKDGYVDHDLHTAMHVGTHIDSPWHMTESKKPIADYPPEKFFGRGVLIDARDCKKIDVDLLENVQLHQGDIVLIWTDFSKKYRTEAYYNDYPELTEKFAHALVEAGISIVGLDTASPDREPFAVHKILLASEVLIIENLTDLAKLQNVHKFDAIALPAKFAAEAAPIRVIVEIK